MRTRAWMVAIPALLLVAACGGATAPVAKQRPAGATTAQLDPRQAVLASVAKTSSTSFLGDMNISATITATGPGASLLGPIQGHAINAAMHVAAESAQRMRLTLTTAVAGKSYSGVAVMYDSTVYVSTNGAAYSAHPITGGFANAFASENTLSYLQSVSNVTDMGATTADGVAVERYSAQLDGAKVLKLIQGVLGSTSQAAMAKQLIGSMTFNGGALEVTIDHQGRVVTEHGPIDASMDLRAFGASLAGTRMTIHEDIDGHFHGYGSAITVAKPAVTASS